METLKIVVGCGGFWVFLQYLIDKYMKKRGKTLEAIRKDISDIKQSYDNNNELTLAISRDRINHLCNKYIEQGYVPLNEYDAFIAIGDSYIKCGGNSIVKEKFIKCKDLKVK